MSNPCGLQNFFSIIFFAFGKVSFPINFEIIPDIHHSLQFIYLLCSDSDLIYFISESDVVSASVNSLDTSSPHTTPDSFSTFPSNLTSLQFHSASFSKAVLPPVLLITFSFPSISSRTMPVSLGLTFWSLQTILFSWLHFFHFKRV